MASLSVESFSFRSPLSLSLSRARAQAAIQFVQPRVLRATLAPEREGRRESASPLSLFPSLENNGGEEFNNVFFPSLARQGQNTPPLPPKRASALSGKRAALIRGARGASLWEPLEEDTGLEALGDAREGERERAKVCNSFKEAGCKTEPEGERTPPQEKREKGNPKDEKALRISPGFSRVSCRYFDSRAIRDLSCACWNEKRDKRREGSPGAAARMPPTKHRK